MGIPRQRQPGEEVWRLGHSNISTTSRYLRASRTDLQTQLTAFEAHRASAAKGTPDSHTGEIGHRSNEGGQSL